LQLGKPSGLFRCSVRHEEGRANPTEHRVFFPPAHPNEIEHRFRFGQFFVRCVPHESSARECAVQDEPMHPLRVTDRIGDGHSASCAIPQDRNPVQPCRIDDGFKIPDTSPKRKVFDPSVRQAAASAVVHDEIVLLGESFDAGSPYWAARIEFGGIQPRGDLDERRAATHGRVGAPHVIWRSAIADRMGSRHHESRHFPDVRPIPNRSVAPQTSFHNFWARCHGEDGYPPQGACARSGIPLR